MSELALRPLGSTGLRVSELALGAVTFGDTADLAASRRILDAYLDAGGNLIDTADAYGSGASEHVLGQLLGERRDQVVLCTKAGMATGTGPNERGATRRHLVTALESSLRRLRTDWIDLYQLHWPDPGTPQEETLSALADFVRAGQVRYIGASNYAGWQLAKGLGLSRLHGFPRYASVQGQYSLASRDSELDLLPLCAEDQVAFLAWGPLGGGVLTGKYTAGRPPAAGSRLAQSPELALPLTDHVVTLAATARAVAGELGRTPAQVALRWVLDRPAVTAALVGARTAGQLQENLGVRGWCLDTEHQQRLTAASRLRLPYPHNLQQAFGVRG
ncbi:MAG TPA: aldo/keto reductase [Streptosporangiaceae bacterium]